MGAYLDVASRRSLRYAAQVAWVGIGVSLSAATVAHAEGPCPIRLVPVDAAEAWQRAVRAAASRLSNLPQPHDCRAVEVVVRPDGGATLAFLTTDGRGAARALDAPSDLLPALDALLVTLPVAPVVVPVPPTPEPPTPVPTLTPAPLPVPPNPAPAPAPGAAPLVVAPAPVSAPDAPPELRFLLGAGAGVRFALGPARYAAPSFALRPSVAVGAWEIGVFAMASPVHQPLGAAAPEGFALWTFATGLSVGRREAIADVEIAYGLTLGVAAMDESADDVPDIALSREVDTAQPELGTTLRVVYPATEPVHATADIDFAAALGRLRDGATKDRALPRLPRFGLGLGLGVEAAF